MTDINEFINKNIFYIIAQDTSVDKEMFIERADSNFCSRNKCDENNYFPLQKSYKSIFYSNIHNEYDSIVGINELMLGIDEIEMDDTFLGLKHRHKHFLNIKQNRAIRDRQASYHEKGDKDHHSLFIAYLGLQ